MEDKLEKEKLLTDLKNMVEVLKETQKDYQFKPEDLGRFFYFDGAISTIQAVIDTIEKGEYDWKSTIILPKGL